MVRRFGTLCLLITLFISGSVLSGRMPPSLLAQERPFQVFLPFINLLDDGDNDGTFFSHYSPVFVVDIQNRIYVDDRPPPERTVIYASGTGDLSRYIANWPVGDFTGYVPTKTNRKTQRGAPNGGYGSTAVQMEGFVTGIHLNHETGQGDGSQYAQLHYEYQPMPLPWIRGLNPRLCFDHDAAVPHSTVGADVINYGYALTALEDTTSGKRLWLLMSMYHSNPSVIERGDLLSLWSETNEPIIYGYYGAEGYTTSMTDSARSTSAAWNEWRHFGYCISGPELQRMIADANAQLGVNMNEDYRVYGISSFAVAAEMYNPEGADAAISLRTKDARLFTLADPQ